MKLGMPSTPTLNLLFVKQISSILFIQPNYLKTLHQFCKPFLSAYRFPYYLNQKSIFRNHSCYIILKQIQCPTQSRLQFKVQISISCKKLLHYTTSLTFLPFLKIASKQFTYSFLLLTSFKHKNQFSGVQIHLTLQNVKKK